MDLCSVSSGEGGVIGSAVVDKPFVDKIGDEKTLLRKYDISIKILFVDIMYFEKEIIHLKNKI